EPPQSWLLEEKSENRLSENQLLASLNCPVFGDLRQSPGPCGEPSTAAVHHRIKGLLVVVWNALACGSRDARHLAAPALRVWRRSQAALPRGPHTARTPAAPRSSRTRGDGDRAAGYHLSPARCSRTAWANA